MNMLNASDVANSAVVERRKEFELWYCPFLSEDSTLEELLKKWAVDYKIPIEKLSRLTEQDRNSAYEALSPYFPDSLHKLKLCRYAEPA